MCTKTNLDWLHVLCVSNHSQASTPCSRYCKENATVWSLGTWLATCTYIHVVTLKWFWWILGATRWTQSVLMRVWATPHPLQCGQCRGLSTVCKLSCKHSGSSPPSCSLLVARSVSLTDLSLLLCSLVIGSLPYCSHACEHKELGGHVKKFRMLYWIMNLQHVDWKTFECCMELCMQAICVPCAQRNLR